MTIAFASQLRLSFSTHLPIQIQRHTLFLLPSPRRPTFSIAFPCFFFSNSTLGRRRRRFTLPSSASSPPQSRPFVRVPVSFDLLVRALIKSCNRCRTGYQVSMAESKKEMDSIAKVKGSFFYRSLTIHSSSLDFPQKPNLQSSPVLADSVKKFYSRFDSMSSARNSIKGKVKQLCNLFETAKSPTPAVAESISRSQSKLKPAKSISSDFRALSIRLLGTEDKIVVYFTSLRGIRRTYEDCYAVRMIFRGFRVCVDERDVSMDMAYKKELESVLGEKNISLPQVFIKGKYVGGVETIKQLFESGELVNILKEFPIKEAGFVCNSCGDVRFVPCMNCSGSRKVFDEEEGLQRRCSDCNENGLIRCPDCCS